MSCFLFQSVETAAFLLILNTFSFNMEYDRLHAFKDMFIYLEKRTELENEVKVALYLLALRSATV